MILKFVSEVLNIYFYFIFFREHTFILILKSGVRGRKKASPLNIGFSKTEIWTDPPLQQQILKQNCEFSAFKKSIYTYYEELKRLPMFSSRKIFEISSAVMKVLLCVIF